MPRTVLITGASSGIGLESAIWIARRGFRVVGTVRSEEKARAVQRVAAQARALEDVDDDEARLALETMVVAPMRLARLALRHMRARGEGRIVNVSSIFGCVATPFGGWYQAAKHALEGVTDALRVEVAAAGVHVVLVQPGGVQTRLWEGLEHQAGRLRGSSFDAAYERYVALLRWMQPYMQQPAGVAAVVGRAMTAFLPRARYLVGCDAQLLLLADRFVPTVVRDRVTRLVL